MEIFTDLGAKDIFLKNLRFYMDYKELSYKDLADLCGFSKQRTSDVFNKPNSLNLKTTDHIALSLGLKENALFDDNFQDRYKKKTK